MKRLMFTILLLFVSKLLFGLASVSQTQYRWRNDNGNEASATWKAAENTAINVSDFSTLRLRIELRNPSGIFVAAGIVDENLEYSKDNGASWNLLNSGPVSPFALVASTNVTNGAATTQQMSAGTAGTFVAGQIVSTAGAATTINAGRKTEFEWVLVPTNNIEPSQAYLFRSSNLSGTSTVFPIANTTCFVPPNPGTIIASSSTISCGNKDTLRLSGHTTGAQITYNWQMNVGAGWTNFGGNVSTLVTGALLSSTDFRCVVKCGTSQSDTTQVKSINVLPPQVYLGPDILKCVEGADSVFLDAGAFPNNPSYQWNDGLTSQTRYVYQSGTYAVTVTDTNTCSGTDSINIGIWPIPPVDLGNDTNVCAGATFVLSAVGNANSYVWNTGNTTNQITIRSPGTYIVKITDSKGCTNYDTIVVTQNGQFPIVDDIIIRNNGYLSFTFMPDNPRYVIAYDWDFGDGTPNSNEQSPTHIYTAPGNYMVILKMQSSCGYTFDTVQSNIVGIESLNIAKDELLIAPNPAYGNAVIVNRGALKMEQIELYGIDGRKIYNVNADSPTQHKLNTEYLPKGIYAVKIITDKGIVVRKLQLN